MQEEVVDSKRVQVAIFVIKSQLPSACLGPSEIKCASFNAIKCLMSKSPFTCTRLYNIACLTMFLFFSYDDVHFIFFHDYFYFPFVVTQMRTCFLSNCNLKSTQFHTKTLGSFISGTLSRIYSVRKIGFDSIKVFQKRNISVFKVFYKTEIVIILKCNKILRVAFATSSLKTGGCARYCISLCSICSFNKKQTFKLAIEKLCKEGDQLMIFILFQASKTILIRLIKRIIVCCLVTMCHN